MFDYAGKLFQQIDILPTLLDYLNITTEFYAFGSSYFSNNKRCAINYLEGVYYYYFDHYMLTYIDGEKPEMKMVRFRTLGCYPLTAGVESTATTLDEVVEEVTGVKLSERATRLIDGETEDSMEKKKREGYL